MLCTRCARSALGPVRASTAALRQGIPTTSIQRLAQSQQQSRSLSVLSSIPSRPTLRQSPATSVLASPIAADTPSSTLQPSAQPNELGLLVRGAKRDTYDPSHRVRKRRHGFLSRIRSRNGRKLLKRRQAKKRFALSH
ncbi:hypothetical protein K431DRAFT_270935 [Polychaeton citri CBS 116435]|uniref:Ribosomal protein L34 n=1 Tax=Polychaeton citri CBS 116435 TaxID=1314669 RepID=A0A9P4Q626_9PEZI|nr:hypothetical protein K431DRAFT_270935 [Polychaeton citri CBS 116435]